MVYYFPSKARIPLKIITKENTIIVTTPTNKKTVCKLVKKVSYAVTFIRANPAKIQAKNKNINLSNYSPSFTTTICTTGCIVRKIWIFSLFYSFIRIYFTLVNTMVVLVCFFVVKSGKNVRWFIMALVKNCVIVLVFMILMVSMIFFGVKTIEAKGTEASAITTQVENKDLYIE